MKLKIDSLERLKHKCFWKKILGNIQMSKTRNDDKVKTLIEVSINLLTKWFLNSKKEMNMSN